MEIWYIVRLDDPPSPPGVVSFDNGKRLSDSYFETYLPGEIEELYQFIFKDGYEALFEALYSMRVAQMKRLDLSNLFFAK